MTDRTTTLLNLLIKRGIKTEMKAYHARKIGDKQVKGVLLYEGDESRTFIFRPTYPELEHYSSWFINRDSGDTFSIEPIERNDKNWIDRNCKPKIKFLSDIYPEPHKPLPWQYAVATRENIGIDMLDCGTKGNTIDPIEILDYTTFITIKTDY